MSGSGVVVTGLGAASALGTGIDAHRAALFAGRDGFRPIERFDTSALKTHLAATWPGWDGRIQPEPGRDRELAATAADFPLHELALVAAREAWSNAFREALIDRKRVAFVFGTCFGQGFDEFSGVAERVAVALELGGPRITISTACSSSTNAIGLGRDLLARGHADIVVAGGADMLLREAFAGFSSLGVLSSEPCAPFSDRMGTTLGEGAGFVVLERADDAARRGATTWASIRGYGLSADAFHETTPDPNGAGVSRAIRGALWDAGWAGNEIDFVSAHATGTENNDRIEWSVIEREAGAAHVSGSKGHIGHTQGAAGVLELVLALICHREGRVPPTLHFRAPRAGCPADPIAGTEPRVLPVARALKLSAAFGGANAVLAYGVGEVAAPPSRARAVVVVAGAGVVGPAGAVGLAKAHRLAEKRNVGPCAAVDLEEFGVDARRLDRSSRWLTAAAALALHKQARDRIGLFVAATRMPEESARRCTESIKQRGIAGTSASAFARMSVNAPTGACSHALGLLGPTSTLSIDEGSGLLSIVLAAEWLAWREDAVGIVAGGVEEMFGQDPDATEGAACVALVRSGAGAVAAAGWGIAGPGGARDAASHAMAGRPAVDTLITDSSDDRALAEWMAPNAKVVVADRVWGRSNAMRWSALAAIAASRIAAGQTRSTLLIASRGASTVALVLEAS